MTPEEKRGHLRTYERERYQTNPDFRAKKLARAKAYRESLKQDPVKLAAAKARTRARERERYNNDPELRARLQAKVRADHERRREDPEHWWIRREGHLKRRYGITLEEYDSMLAEQGGGCAICSGTTNRKRPDKALHVDHCHSTGRVRGILCDDCNLILGHAEDSVERLRRAVSYLESTDPPSE